MFFGFLDDNAVKQQLQPGSQQSTAEPPQPKQPESGYLKEGAVCERANHDPKAECFLDAGQRARVIAQIDSNLNYVSDNYNAALHNAKLETVLKKAKGWGVVGELMFNALTAALLGGVGWAVARIAKVGVQAVLDAEFHTVMAAVKAGSSVAQAEKAVADAYITANASAATAAVRQVTTVLRPGIMAHLEGLTPEIAMQAAFITRLQSAATPTFMGVRDTVQETGDDAALVAVLAGYNPNVLSLAYFAKQISEVLDRFGEHHFESIGPRMQGGVRAGTKEVVLIAAHGYSRLAIVEFGEVKRMGSSRGDTHYTDGSHHFVRFVDEDMLGAAADVQRASLGKTQVIDVHAGHQFLDAAALDKWIAQARSGRGMQPSPGTR